MKRTTTERKVTLISGEIATITDAGELSINGRIQELSVDFVNNHLERFFNQQLPYLYLHELRRAIMVFPTSNKDNFWVNFVSKAG